jgi:aerobic carbon-monoxide dehydrogenase medium subunit
MYETALAPDELITSVEFPIAERAGYEKFQNPASHFALVGVFVAKHAGGVRVAITGAAPSVFRASALEAALSKDFSAAAARGTTISADTLNEDMHASAAYRAHLIPILAGRAVDRAIGF